jgi:hypothetical protein
MKTTQMSRITLVLTLLVQGIASTVARAQAPAGAPGPQSQVRLDSALRFRNTTIVTSVEDRRPLPRPVERDFFRAPYFFDAYLGQRTVRLMSSDPGGRARNVNAVDEVPDSSWFENRIGARPLGPDELRHRRVAPPRAPFMVVGMKVGGMSLGVRVRDANGVAYLLKFDRPKDPDSETAADIVLQRLLWAVGYLTPEDTIVSFRGKDLRLDPRAKRKDLQGRSSPMTAADLTDVLSKAGRKPDGSYRGLLSRLLDGIPVGGYAQEGVRSDDPNDTIPHQDRREVRGTRVFFSWLNQVDVKEDNCLDTWIPDQGTPGAGHLRHHLVDFGNSLGVFDWQSEPAVGFAQMFDASYGARSLVSFGLWKRPWEGRPLSPLQGVGNFESARFDPANWRPQYPWAPYEKFDRFDGAWGARILMNLSPAHIAAAVAEGQYQDPRSAAYITQTLIERQRKIGRYYLTQTSGLDAFAVSEDAEGSRFCFDDRVVIHFGAEEPGLVSTTRHRIASWDFMGRPLSPRIERTGAAQVCVDGLALAPDHDGYTILDIETTRAGTPVNRVLVHVAREAGTREPRVIGIRRL